MNNTSDFDSFLILKYGNYRTNPELILEFPEEILIKICNFRYPKFSDSLDNRLFSLTSEIERYMSGINADSGLYRQMLDSLLETVEKVLREYYEN